jgi:hypothetical protein
MRASKEGPPVDRESVAKREEIGRFYWQNHMVWLRDPCSPALSQFVLVYGFGAPPIHHPGVTLQKQCESDYSVFNIVAVALAAVHLR